MKTRDYPLAYWKGSERTAKTVYKQIAERWGEEEARNYNPLTNCFTFKTWMAKGYRIKKGEKALRSVTFILGEEKGNSTSEEEDSQKYYPKTVCLFYIKQVEKRENK